MKNVLDLIHRRVSEQERNPFLQWLGDESIPARTRLGKWLPTAAFFIMAFKDLNEMVFRYPDQSERTALAEALNEHTVEEARHWKWFLDDLRLLGLDGEVPLSSTLTTLWSERARAQRWAVYRICQLASEAENPILRYCIIRAIEAFGHVLFERVARVAVQLEKEGIRLRYLGQTHLRRETGELQTADEGIEVMLGNVELSPAQLQVALRLV